MSVESFGILVPTAYIARVIGRGGAGLKRLREECGVKVKVDSHDDPYSAAHRRVDLFGSVESCTMAFRLIAAETFAAEANASAASEAPNMMIIVTSAAIGRVIGKGGDNLRRVRELCGVHVAPAREDSINRATQAQERVITLTGHLARAPEAVRSILASTADTARRDQLAPHSGSIGLPYPAARVYGLPAGFMPLGGLPMSGRAGSYMGKGGQGSPASCLMGLRLQTPSAGEVQLHLHLPDRLVGVIIGNQGARLKQTAADAGCRISVTSREACLGRRAVIIGSLPQCERAQELLHAQLVEGEAPEEGALDVTVTYFVPSAAASSVIGKQASTLKAIRETCNTKIQFAREEVCSHRPCSITGSLPNVLQAERQIHETIESCGTGSSENMTTPPGFDPAEL